MTLWNGMSHGNHLNGKRARRDFFVIPHHMDELIPLHTMLIILCAQQRSRKRRDINGQAQAIPHIGQRSHVVFMSVGDDNPFDMLLVMLQKLNVRKDEVNSGLVVTAKGHAAIHHQPFAPAAVHAQVHANLARPPQGQKQNFVVWKNSLMIPLRCVMTRHRLSSAVSLSNEHCDHSNNIIDKYRTG